MKVKKQTPLGRIYRKTIGRIIPDYALLSLISCFMLNMVIYFGTQYIMAAVPHWDLTNRLDDRIPFVKEWVIVYVGCYLFWAVNYILVTREGKDLWYRFAAADMTSRLICGFFFLILPTTNIRPPVEGNDIYSDILRFVYEADMSSNLFPSIHCLVSWFCVIGIRKSTKIPCWYKILSVIIAILVFISTVMLKQHYLIDILGGVVLAEFCYWIYTGHPGYKKLMAVYDSIHMALFGEAENAD